MTDLKYEYGSCLPITLKDSPQLHSDSSSPSTEISPNRVSWGSDGERATSSSDGEKTRSSPDEHFYSHESSSEHELGASARSNDGGPLSNSMEYLGLDVMNLYPESGRAQWPKTPESQEAGFPNIEAGHHIVQQNDIARTTTETLRTSQPIHASYNGFTDFPAIANDSHKDSYPVSIDTTFQRAPPLPNVSTSIVRAEETVHQTLPKLETANPIQAPSFPSKPGPSLVPYPPIAHQQPTYQSAQNVPYATYAPEANKGMQEVAYPQLYPRNLPPPLKESEINFPTQMQDYLNITNTVSDSGFQDFAIGNRGYSGVLNINMNHVSESHFSPRAPIAPEVHPPNIPPLQSNLAAPQRAATSSSHFKGNYNPLPDVSLPPPKYNKPDAHFARPRNPPRRAVVGRPVVGRPPVSLPIDNTAVQCSDEFLLGSIAFAQLNVSWNTCNEINALKGNYCYEEDFEDLVKVFEESSPDEDMGSYVRRKIKVKEAREARRLNEHERQERLKELAIKLEDEQASLRLPLATGGNNAVWASPPSKHQNAPPASAASTTSDKETFTNNISLFSSHHPDQQKETTDSEHINFSHTGPSHKFFKTIDVENEINKILGRVEAQHAGSSGSFLCTFCRQNGETKEFYSSHNLKDAKGKIICPTLRAFVCPFCGATGASAHTASYCPRNPNSVRVKHSPHKKNREGFTRYSHGLKYTG